MINLWIIICPLLIEEERIVIFLLSVINYLDQFMFSDIESTIEVIKIMIYLINFVIFVIDVI